MRQIRVVMGPFTAPSANNIALSQTPLAGGNLTLNGSTVSSGVAVLDTQRRVLFTFAGNEAARTFTVYGTNGAGTSISESVAGTAPGTTYTTLDYKTVTRIAVDAATAGALTVGTNQVASSYPVPLDIHGLPMTSLQVAVSGTINYTIQQTLDSPYDSSLTPTWINHADTNLVAATGNVQGNYAYIPAATRILINSFSGSATAAFTVIQAGAGQV